MKIGITGHQNIGSDSTIDWVREQLRSLVVDKHVCEGYTCLAIGADQLFAEVLLAASIPYVAIIPAKDYVTTFSAVDDKTRYENLLKQAAHVHQMPSRISTEEAFFEAGKQVVQFSEMLFAVWNGKPAQGLGGTADVVQYALQTGKDVIHLNTLSQTCVVICASRPATP